MRRAIFDLERLADDALFRELSEGMPLIFDNAAGLDESARRLYRDGALRASDIVRGFGEEEAAKVLILIDYVRCPRGFKKRGEILKRFYSHVAKRIYAITCSYPKIASFGELSKLVESECRPWYLDGPNGIDWILPNAISAEREQALYVDYMRGRHRRWRRVPLDGPGTSIPLLIAIYGTRLYQARPRSLRGRCLFR